VSEGCPDYGAVRIGRSRLGLWIAAGLGVLIVLGVIGANLVYAQHKAVATAAQWAIDGPPCPQLTPAAFQAQPYRPKRVFAYDDIRFARVAGHVSCEEVHAGGGRAMRTFVECQFTSPGLPAVATKAGETVFAPGPGRPATVVVQDRRPRCMLASKFTLRGEGE